MELSRLSRALGISAVRYRPLLRMRRQSLLRADGQAEPRTVSRDDLRHESVLAAFMEQAGERDGAQPRYGIDHLRRRTLLRRTDRFRHRADAAHVGLDDEARISAAAA